MRWDLFMIHFPVLWEEDDLGYREALIQVPFVCFLAVRPWTQYLMHLNVNFLICKIYIKCFNGVLKVTWEKSVSAWQKKNLQVLFEWCHLYLSFPILHRIGLHRCYKTEIIKIYSVRLRDQEGWALRINLWIESEKFCFLCMSVSEKLCFLCMLSRQLTLAIYSVNNGHN